jgi:cysteinyl-tRNA synthetase
MDLRFPHHENEQAQAHAAGRPYATHWLHNALVLSGGQKMSKSLGNGVPAADLLKRARPIVLRYALASAHYRSELDLHEGFLQEASTAFGRIESFLRRAGTDGIDLASELPGAGVAPAAFAAAMDDDLGIPEALAVLHDVVRTGNHAADSGLTEPYIDAARAVRAMVGVLGIDPLDEQWQGDQASPGVLDSLMENLIALRATARTEGNFALSDALRDTVDDSGIDIKDDPSNSTWSIRG